MPFLSGQINRQNMLRRSYATIDEAAPPLIRGRRGDTSGAPHKDTA
jgi:hypothetical protein